VGSSGGRDLIGFDLVFENISGDAGGNPFNLELHATGDLHQHSAFGSIFSPTLDGFMSDALDTHFNVSLGDLLSVVAPVEDAGAAPSDVPGGAVAAYGYMDTYSFGTSLDGLFNASAARPAGTPLRSTDWNVAHFVTYADQLGVGYHLAYGEISGLTMSETFDLYFIPEPATMSLLGLGALAMLKRRRK